MKNKTEIHASYYKEAERHLNSNVFSNDDDNLWYKALTKAKGNEEEAKYIFIELKAEELQTTARRKAEYEHKQDNRQARSELYKFLWGIFFIVLALFNLPLIFQIAGYIFTPTVFIPLIILIIGAFIYYEIKEKKVVKEIKGNARKELSKPLTWIGIIGFFLLIVFMN